MVYIPMLNYTSENNKTAVIPWNVQVEWLSPPVVTWFTCAVYAFLAMSRSSHIFSSTTICIYYTESDETIYVYIRSGDAGQYDTQCMRTSDMNIGPVTLKRPASPWFTRSKASWERTSACACKEPLQDPLLCRVCKHSNLSYDLITHCILYLGAHNVLITLKFNY